MQLSSQTLSLSEKLNLLADAAKYDVACTSSGVNRAGKQGHLGNSVSCGICHSFSSDGRCISLLKILQSNDCIYDCKYCVNRAGNDRQRATFTPEEVCTLVTEFYRRNYIEGLFLSSAVCKNPAHTMELMYRTLHLLRNRYRFNGYIHVKAIPGAPVELIEKTSPSFGTDFRTKLDKTSPSTQCLPNEAKNFSAYAELSGFFVCYNTFICRKDCDSKSTKYSRNIFCISIYAKSRLGDSLNS